MVHWVRIPATDGLKAPVLAEADRATNTLKLTVPDVRQVTVFLNAALVDFTKPVQIERLEILIQRALKVDPDNVMALSLAATAAYNRKDVPQAIALWERLQQLVPPDSEDGQWLKQALMQVRAQQASAPQQASGKAAKGAASGAAASAGATPAASEKPSGSSSTAFVGGRITLAASLSGKVQPTDTVFIFARAPQGRNEPGELPRIGAAIAALRGISPEELAEATLRNACEALTRLGGLLPGRG